MVQNFEKISQLESQFAKLFEDTSLKGFEFTIPII